MLFIIGSVIIAFLALMNYRMGFLLYLLYQMIWFPDTQVLEVGGSSINVNFLMATFFVILYVLKSKGNIKLLGKKFPYTIPMICIAISMFLTCFTSLAGFFSEFVKAAGLVVMDMLVVNLIWRVEKKEDYVFLFKGLTIIILIASIYCLFESVTNLNPILEYKMSYASGTMETYADYEYGFGRGYRCYSIFEHPICASMVFALYTAFVLNIYMKKRKLPYKYLTIATTFLSTICIFFTKQRAGMFLLAVAVLPCVDLKKKKFYKLALIGLVGCLLIMPFISNYLFVLLSTFIPNINNGAGGVVGGSNTSMRLMQLNAVFNIMQQSPITGLGENFKRLYSSVYAAQALDFESLWFEQMAKHGLAGVVSYIVMIYYSLIKIPKRYRSKTIFFISLAYWLTYTLTSTPYFRTYFYYAVIFYLMKFDKGIKAYSRNKMISHDM